MQQERHKWLCDVMNVMHSNRCIVSIWNACKVPPSAAIRQDKLGKYTSSCEQYINCGKLNEHTILKLWTLIKNIVERTHKFPYNILFTFLMDRGRAANGIGHLMILNVYQNSESNILKWTEKNQRGGCGIRMISQLSLSVLVATDNQTFGWFLAYTHVVLVKFCKPRLSMVIEHQYCFDHFSIYEYMCPRRLIFIKTTQVLLSPKPEQPEQDNLKCDAELKITKQNMSRIAEPTGSLL